MNAVNKAINASIVHRLPMKLQSDCSSNQNINFKRFLLRHTPLQLTLCSTQKNIDISLISSTLN